MVVDHEDTDLRLARPRLQLVSSLSGTSTRTSVPPPVAGADLQPTAEQPCPLLHSQQPDALGRARPAERVGNIKAPAVIGHGNRDLALADGEPNVDVTGLRVFRDVCERLLGDPEERDLDVGRQSLGGPRSLHPDLDPLVAEVTLGVPADRR